MFCPQCGAPNDEDSIFCGNCGAVLKPDDLPAEPVEELPEAVETATPQAESVEKMLDVTPARQALPPPPPPRPAPSPPPAPPARPAPSPRHAPSPQRAQVSPPASGLAIASLLLGIGGLTVLPLLGSILALLFGYMARGDIRRRRGEVSGEGLAMAGIVLGWISVGLAVLGIVVVGGLGLCGMCGAFGSGNW